MGRAESIHPEHQNGIPPIIMGEPTFLHASLAIPHVPQMTDQREIHDMRLLQDALTNKRPRLTVEQIEELKGWTADIFRSKLVALKAKLGKPEHDSLRRRRHRAEEKKSSWTDSEAVFTDFTIVPKYVVYVGYFLVESGDEGIYGVATMQNEASFLPSVSTVHGALNYCKNLLERGQHDIEMRLKKQLPREKFNIYKFYMMREAKLQDDIDTEKRNSDNGINVPVDRDDV